MKSALEIVRDVHSLIDVPSVNGAISGSVYQLYKPDSSKLHDVVVGILGADNEWMQQGTVNVKNHVPDLPDGQPDLEALDISTDIITKILDGNYQSDFYTIVSQTIPRQDTDGTWFNRIVVDYYSIQKEFKNI